MTADPTELRIPEDAMRRLAEMRPGQATSLFTSDLSVNEFLLVREAGFRPLGLVLGSSIYHVGFQFGRWNKNQELATLSQAMYHARELAMNRMEVEADQLGADGIVGVRLDIEGDTIRVRSEGNLRSADISTEEYPGFPTDMQAQYMALATQADGSSVVVENIFENRFMHVQELARFGVRIHLDGETATIEGIEKLRGAPVMATDLRASVSLVIAGLAAEGETMVNRIYHLDRGFERLEEKLSACGATIERISG